MTYIPERRCKVCGLKKTFDQFEPDAWNPKNKNADYWVRACKHCRYIHEQVNFKVCVSVEQLRAKGQAIEKKYRISLKEYENFYIKQNGLCAICHRPESIKSRLFLAVDHDHKTGRVRGLLCSNCNTGLGMFEDRIYLFQSAIRYLKKSSPA